MRDTAFESQALPGCTSLTGRRYVELAQQAHRQGDRVIAEWLIELAFMVLGGGEAEEAAS